MHRDTVRVDIVAKPRAFPLRLSLITIIVKEKPLNPSSLLRSRLTASIIVIILGVLTVSVWLFNGQSLGGRWSDVGARSVAVVTDGYAPADTTGVASPQLQEARFTQVDLRISGISGEAAMWFRAAVITSAVSMGAASLTFLVLGYRVVRGIPFGDLFSRLATGSGLILLIGGILAPVADALGTFHAINGVRGIHEAGPGIMTGDWMYYFPFTFDPVPLALGLVFLLLAAVLSRGTAHYNDVKNLV